MNHQLEITTRCNFNCYYCAGRDMDQQDMQWDRFISIIDSIGTTQSKVTLQGEGEPTLHSRFFDMARYVISKGHIPHAIMNGSRVNAGLINELFPTISISVDTLSAEEAEKIGRYNLDKVLANIELLLNVMDPKRITIMTVDYKQPLGQLREWVSVKGFKHIIQPLQEKDDYAKRYIIVFKQHKHEIISTCTYLKNPIMRFYPLKDLVLPCCFIKDTAGIDSIEQLSTRLKNNDVPAGCSGCKHLSP